MRQPPARHGDPLEAVDTPALIVDLDALERNIARMQAGAAAAGVALRPHAKTHKCPVIGGWQVTAGAVGLCCQKTEEAERLVEGGIKDVYISNEVVGDAKLVRLAELANHARLSVCVDDARGVAALEDAAARAGSKIDVLVELEVGGGRCGVRTPQAAADLAARVAAAPCLSFAGLHVYNGAVQHVRTAQERRAAAVALEDKVGQALALLTGQGLSCGRITGAGTGSFAQDLEAGILTELQCGSYVFMDADYARNRDAAGGFEQSLFVLATVMSAPASDLIVVDAGLKALAFDSGPPLVHGHADLVFAGPSDEHGEITGPAGRMPAWGEKLELVPGHCDPTVNLHDFYVGMRAGRVEKVWPIAARGAGR
jgi:D-serine deaminase-like pyridoxal phosphate-dependent protein